MYIMLAYIQKPCNCRLLICYEIPGPNMSQVIPCTQLKIKLPIQRIKNFQLKRPSLHEHIIGPTHNTWANSLAVLWAKSFQSYWRPKWFFLCIISNHLIFKFINSKENNVECNSFYQQDFFKSTENQKEKKKNKNMTSNRLRQQNKFWKSGTTCAWNVAKHRHLYFTSTRNEA